MNEQEYNLFIAIAQAGIDAGKEISLEKKGWEQKSNVLGGAFTESGSTDNGIILRVFGPVNAEESDGEDGSNL